jgi:DNA-binding transcriptional ArsR family regulator
MDNVFAALSDPHRIEIIKRLSSNERAVGELANELGRSQPTVSKALRVLRDAGLVNVRTVGQLRFYSLRRERLGEVAQWALGLSRNDQ